jgi:Double-GTPase 1
MNRKLVIAGMPESGKSTFIAALRHLLVSQDVPTALVATRLSDAEKHLNRLENEWIACEKVERTKQTVEEWVSLFVRREDDLAEAEIVVPDFSGEAFRRPAATGHCSTAVAAMLLDIDGMLLFTNADRGVDDVRIEQFADLLADDNALRDVNAVPGDMPARDDAPAKRDASRPNGTEPDDSVAFDPRNMPEEPLLVEMLQILNRPPRAPKERMIAIVVSAWDEVDESDLAPEDWLKRNRPMVWQYLRSNTALWKVRVYGVSAQGGRLPQDKEALQGKVPGHRVQIIGYGARPHDLTAPIEWLMALN